MCEATVYDKEIIMPEDRKEGGKNRVKKSIGYSTKELGLVLATIVGGLAVVPYISLIYEKQCPPFGQIIASFGLALLCYVGTIWYSFFANNPAGKTEAKKIELNTKKHKRISIIGIVFLIVSFIIPSCEKDTNSVKVGVIGPFTGDVASYGELVRNAAELACEEVNAEGGINGKVLKLIYEDTEGLPEKAVSATKKLISLDKVSAILGATTSSATYAAGVEAQSKKVVLFTPISSADNISTIGDYVFRLAPYDSLQAEIVADWVLKSGHKKAAILHVNNDYGVGLANAFKNSFESSGGTIVIVQSFEQGATSMRAQWQNIKSSTAEAVFAPAYPVEAASILIQRKELALNIPLFGTDPYHDPTVLATAKEATEGVFFTDVAEGSGKAWNEFLANYEQKYGSKPNIVAAESYDTVKLVSEIMNKIGITSEDIQQGLAEIQGYIGATGLIEFNENGDCVTKSFNKYMIKNKSYSLIQ